MQGTPPTTTSFGHQSSPEHPPSVVDSELALSQKSPSSVKGLKAFAQTIAAISYPTALLCGDNCVLLHNKAWEEAGSVRDQGQPQRHHLPLDFVAVLDEVARDGISRHFPSGKLLNPEAAKASKYAPTASLTPLSGPDTESCIVSMVRCSSPGAT